MKKLFAIFCLFAVAGLALASSHGEKGSWTGWVSDANCGAKGANAAHKDCLDKCVKGGTAIVFVTGSGETQKVLKVSNPDTLVEHGGHEIKVTGMVADDTLTVDSVEMVQ
jgi:ABC-type glycerol-3-phosphate transport system substrate-binding protein